MKLEKHIREVEGVPATVVKTVGNDLGEVSIDADANFHLKINKDGKRYLLTADDIAICFLYYKGEE